MTTSEKIALYKKFDEGCELGDAVRLLLNAASILNGISCDHELALVMLTVEKIMRDYMEKARDRWFDWEEYQDIDPQLYSYLLGGARKLTQEEYE
jgi:hypothetical protein